MKKCTIVRTGSFTSKPGFWIQVSTLEGRFVATYFVEVAELLDTDVPGTELDIPSKLLK